MEEIHSLRYFGRNAGCFAMQIVAITDWGWKYMDTGFKYPIPAFPPFLFTPLLESHQGGSSGPHQADPGERTQRGRAYKEPGGLEMDGGGAAILGGRGIQHQWHSLRGT